MSRSVSAVSSADKRDAHNNEGEFIVDNLNDGTYYDHSHGHGHTVGQRFSAGVGSADENKSGSFYNILVDGSPYVGSPRGAHDVGIFALSGGSTGNTTGYEGRQEGSSAAGGGGGGGGAALGRGVNTTSSTSGADHWPSTTAPASGGGYVSGTTTYSSIRRLSSVERRGSVSATQLRVPVPHKTASVTWPDNKRVMLSSTSGATTGGASVTSGPFTSSSSSAIHQRRNSSGVSRLPLSASGAGVAVVAGLSTTPPSTARRPSVSVSSAHNNGAPSVPRGRSLSVSSATHLQHNITNNKQAFDLVPPTDASKLAALNVGEYELAKAGYAALPPPTDPRAEKVLRTRGIQNYARMHSNIERMQSEMQSFLEEQMRRAIEADPRIRTKQMKFKDKDGKPRAPTAEEERDLDRQQELLDELISNIYGVRQSSARFMRLFLSEEEKRHVGAKTHESFGKDTGDKDRSPPRRYNPFRHHVNFPMPDDPAYATYANSPSKRNSLTATRRGTAVRAGGDSNSPQPRGGRTNSISTEFYNNHFNNNFRGFGNDEGSDGGIAGGGGSSAHSSSAPNNKNGGGRGGAANHNANTSGSGVNNNNNNNYADSSVSTNGRRGGEKGGGEEEGDHPLFLDINDNVNGAGRSSSQDTNAIMNNGHERRHMFSGGGRGRAGGGGPDGQQATIGLVGDNAVMLNSHGEAMVVANLNPEDVSVSAEESEEEDGEGEGGAKVKGRSSTPLQVPLLVGLTSDGDVEAPNDAFGGEDEENEHERERRQKKEQLRAEKEARKRERDAIRARREEEKRLRKLLEEQDAEALALAAAAAAEALSSSDGDGEGPEIELAPGKKVVVDPATAIALLMVKEEEDESEERRRIGREETFARRRLAEDEAEEAEHQRRQAATAAWKRRIADEDAAAAALAAAEAAERAKRRAKEQAELNHEEQTEDLLLREKLVRRAILAEEAEALAAMVSARAEHAEALRASAEEAAEAAAAAALIFLSKANADKSKSRNNVETDDDVTNEDDDDEDNVNRDGYGRPGRRGKRHGGGNSSSDSDSSSDMATAPQPIVLLPSTTRTPALAPAKKTRAKTKTTYGICARSDGTVGGYDVSLRGSEAGEGSEDEGESGSAQQNHTDPLVVAAVIKRIFGEDILISKDGSEAEGSSPVRRRTTKNGAIAIATITGAASTSRKGPTPSRGGYGDNDDGEEATTDGGLITVTRRKYRHPGGVPTPRSRSRSMPASLATTPRRQNEPTNSEGRATHQHHVRKGSNSALLPLSSSSPHKQNNNAVASSSSAKGGGGGVPSSRLILTMRVGGASGTAGSEASQTPRTAGGKGGGGILKHKPTASAYEEDNEKKGDAKPVEINSGGGEKASSRKWGEGQEVVAALNPRNLESVVGGASSQAKPRVTPTSQTKNNNINNNAKERRPTATTLSSLPLEKSLVSSSTTAVASSQLVDDYLNSLPTSMSPSQKRRGAESDGGAWGITNVPASPPHIISGGTKGSSSASAFNAKGGAKPSHPRTNEEEHQQKEGRHNSSSVATAANNNNNVSVNQMNSIRHRSTDDAHEDNKDNNYNDDDDDGFKSAISRSVSAGRSLGGTGRGGGVHDDLHDEDASDRKVPEAISAGRGAPRHHDVPTSSLALPDADKDKSSSTPNKTKRVLVKKKRLLSKSPPPGARRNSTGNHVDPALV